MWSSGGLLGGCPEQTSLCFGGSVCRESRAGVTIRGVPSGESCRGKCYQVGPAWVHLKAGKIGHLVGVFWFFSSQIPERPCSCPGTGAKCVLPVNPSDSSTQCPQRAGGWREGKGGSREPLPLPQKGSRVCICFPKVTVNRCDFNVIFSQLCLTCGKQETRDVGYFPLFQREDRLYVTLTGLA